MTSTTVPHHILPCPPKLPLEERDQMPPEAGHEVARLFKLLANETRLRLLHALVREGELSVSELAQALDMKPQAICNQLRRLSDCRLIDSRRDGISVYYRIIDNCVLELITRGWCLSEESRQRRAEVPAQEARG